jgi:glycerol-3-phosphate dehydrogenase
VLKHGGVIDRRLSRLMGTALWAYDLTGGLRIGKRHARVSIDDAVAHMPTLARERLAGAYVLYDAQADDARLTLTIARTAAARGAAVANYASVTQLLKDGARIVGARVLVDGEEIEVRARCVVNAVGVWADDVRALDEGTNPATIRPAKGVHITVPWSLVQNRIAAVIPVPKDRRSVFVVPWGGEGGDYQFTYIGTTDTDYDGPIDDPQITPEDVEYLLRAINGAVTTTITASDILGTWAGLRPLVKAATSERTADLSRRHSVTASAGGVITVTGGKLTTYRRMAADAVDEAVKELGIDGRKSRTKRVRLHGAAGWDAPDLPTELAMRYGGDAREVVAMTGADATLAAPIVPGLPYSRAEVVYAVRAEMARTVDDVLSRRTRARLLARDASAGAASGVASIMAAELGWDDAERDRQVEQYRALVEAERVTGGLPETALEALTQPPP